LEYLLDMENKPHVLVVGGDAHLRELALTLRIADSLKDGEILAIAGEPVEEIERNKLLQLHAIEIKRVFDMEEKDFPVESKPRFSDRWKGGTGPGSTAPIRRGKKR
jgi:hypothetical protein